MSADRERIESLVHLEGACVCLPGIATVHSHVFQRALRGRTHRRATQAGSFWSWRELMYRVAERVTPDDMRTIARFAYAELALNGVTAVGEFQYIHHNPDGTPYAQRTMISEILVDAAREAGLRISLLRVLYARGGFGRPLEPAQRRFSDASVDDALRDIETLRTKYKGAPDVRVGIAPHSVRALPAAWLEASAQYANEHKLPAHVHVSEQRREIHESLAEHGKRPLEYLASVGLVSDRFVAVHGTHLTEGEAVELASAQGLVCICRSTERDLGDGLSPGARFRAAGVRVAFGFDSYAISDPFEEARAYELDARAASQARIVAMEAPALLRASTVDAYASLGFTREECISDRVELDANDPTLVGVDEASAADMVIFAARGASVKRVRVADRVIVEDGKHEIYEQAAVDYQKLLPRLID